MYNTTMSKIYIKLKRKEHILFSKRKKKRAHITVFSGGYKSDLNYQRSDALYEIIIEKGCYSVR